MIKMPLILNIYIATSILLPLFDYAFCLNLSLSKLIMCVVFRKNYPFENSYVNQCLFVKYFCINSFPLGPYDSLICQKYIPEVIA